MGSISFVNANFQQGPREINAYYLPYTVGCLWAYANTHKTINNNLKLNKLIWRRDEVDEVVSKLQYDRVVAFSCYIWNKNYHYAIAKKLKEVNPNMLLVFGGPEVPIHDPELFIKYPFMDVVVKSEGEVTFRDLLVSFIDNNNIESIPGLLINYGGNIKNTGNASRINDLDILPSPYLTGVFDDIMTEEDDVVWNVTLETNRGCPYKCTFCDWGSLTHSKVKKWGLDRVFAELEWMAKNKIDYFTIADANFGLFIERDNLIADKIIELQNTYGYPQRWGATWAKNQKQEIVDLVKKFFKSSKKSNGMTLSVQSMSLDVLENIERKNLGQHEITKIFDLCNKNNIPVHTEIILGLPGETKESWKDNFWQLFSAGNHTGIFVFQAQLLKNAQMNLSQRKQFDMKSTYVYDYMNGSCLDDDLKEEIEIVKSTKDLSFEDMIDSQMFTWFITTFHIDGFSTYIARFANKYFGIEYSEFYDNFEKFLDNDPWFTEEKKKARQYYMKWMTKGVVEHDGIGGIEIYGWNLEHTGSLTIIDQNKYDHIMNLIEEFLLKEKYVTDLKLVSQLMDFNKSYFADYNKLHEYPLKRSYDYDFRGYLIHDKPLKKPSNYSFEFLNDPKMSKTQFLEQFIFGRRLEKMRASLL